MKRFFIVLLFALLCFNYSMATVVKSTPTQVRQSDGTTLTMIPYGDERVSWYRTVDEYTLMISSNNDFVYAIDNGKGGIKSSDVIAHNPEERSEEENKFLLTLEKKLFYSREQVSLMKQYIDVNIDYSKKVNNLKAANGEVENYKMLVILMSFSDYAFTTPKQDVDDLFNQVGYSKNGHPGSVHDYFDASTSGMLNLSATVVGPYVSDSVQSYYGKQEGSINDLNVRALIKEAVKKANDDVDYSEFTNGNPNNYVSCVYVIYAGYAQSSNAGYPDLIWPHRSVIYPQIILDGAKIQDYGCSSELDGVVGYGSPMSIGTICHEFSHVLGQPDHYDTDYEENGSAFHPGEWDIMSSGNYNGDSKFPPLWNAKERSNRGYMTFIDAEVDNDYTLEELSKSNKSVRLKYSNLPNEYYILENRQQKGFDYYLPGHGLLIYKVDNNASGWSSNCANCDTSRLGFELITANGSKHTYSWGGWSYGQNQPFPGSTNKRSFTDNTDPSSKSYDGQSLNKPLYRITENTTTQNITFHVGDTTSYVDVYNAKIQLRYDTIKATASLKNYSMNVTEKGFLYSQDATPNDTNSTKQIDNSSQSNISVNLLGLEGNTTYYLRPYAKTSSTISYGEIIQFKTPCQIVNTFPYEEYFLDSLNCWTQENEIYVSNNWQVDSNNHAYIKNDFVWGKYSGFEQPLFKLITPPMNTTVLDNPILVFSHLQKTLSSNSDTLRIYYKTGLENDWTLLKKYSSAIENWQTDTITLPVKSQTLYIAFEAALQGGDGIYIDSVIVTDKTITSWPVVDFTSVYDITDKSATFKANLLSSGYTSIVEKGIAISTTPNPTIDDMVISSTDATLGEYILTDSTLTPSTIYYARAFARNQGMITYSTEKTFTTKCEKIKDFPYTPDLSSADTMCFETVGDKLILPILDLSNKDSMAVIYHSTRNTTSLTLYSVEVYYRDGVDGQWELLNITEEPSGQTITVTIPTLNHQSDNAYIAFSGAGLSSGNYLLDSITVKAMSQIAFVSTDSIALSQYNAIYAEGNISYEGITPNTQRGFVYSTSPNPTLANSKVVAGSGSGTFSATITSLQTLTTYYVRAFATNSFGTAYGEQMTITTKFVPIYNNTISSDQHLCVGVVPSILMGSTPTGGSGEYEYLWIYSTDSINWEECSEGSVTTNSWYEPKLLQKTTYYRRIVTSYVSVDTSNVVSIIMDPQSKGGNVFALQSSIKQNEDVTLQVRAYVGQILYWERLAPGYDWVQIDSTADLEYLTDRPTEVGEYSYRAVVKSGVCSSSTSGEDIVTVEEGVGIEQIDDSPIFTLSPNPTKDVVYIKYNGQYNDQQVNIIITNSNGQIVYNGDILLNNDVKIDVHSLPMGSYILTIRNNDIYQNTKLIISK